MQKVVGSSPIIRSHEPAGNSGRDTCSDLGRGCRSGRVRVGCSSNRVLGLPGDELPSWLPGHKLRSHPAHGHHHKRHGLVAFILGVTYLSGAYLVSRDRRAR